MQGSHLGRPLFQLSSLRFQPGNHLIHLAFPLQVLLGPPQNLWIQLQPLGNGQGIGAAWDPPQKAIGGGQGDLIKLHRGIFKAGMLVFQAFNSL
jgi:hypothetical protein